MPRFGMKSLMIATGAIALWLSTFTKYTGAFDVRKSILLSIFLASGIAVVYKRGRQRAFWIGFFAVMLLCGGIELQRPLYRYTPDSFWTISDAYYKPVVPVIGPVAPGSPTTVPPSAYAAISNFEPSIYATIAAAWILALALLNGYIAAAIYDHSRKTEDKSR